MMGFSPPKTMKYHIPVNDSIVFGANMERSG